MKVQRAKAIMDLIDRMSRDFSFSIPEKRRMAMAAAKLTEKLGTNKWRREVELGGLTPPPEMKDTMDTDVKKMYQKIQNLLGDYGENQLRVDDGRTPGEDDKPRGLEDKKHTKCKNKKPRKSKGRIEEKVSIIIGGKL